MPQRIVDRLSKWKLHRFYAKNPKLISALPPTAVLTPLSLEAFVRRYGSVYIKASTIHTGRGIVKAWRTSSGYHFVRVRGKVQHATSAEHLINRVKEIAPNELFIVQKAIDLATIQGRPYDLRVMMMRDGGRNWKFAGMVAKIHGQGSIVSNIRRGGGYVQSVQKALEASNFSASKIAVIRKQLITVSEEIIRYSEKYPFYSFQSGIDLAVDKKGKVWVIEVNLHNPSHGLFKKLKDQTDYTRVRKLFRDYLRHNKRVI